MANIAFKKGLLANLPATYAEGTIYVTTDERAMYLDIDDSTRIRLGDFQEFANLAALQKNENPSTTALYYITDLNVLAKWNGSAYVQINLDTGATSVEVIGSGNAVTAASYDAGTRKLTLTMGTTFATPDDVDTKIDEAIGDLGNKTGDTPYADVKDYVDTKIADVVAGSIEGLGDLASKDKVAEVDLDTTLAQKINAKAEKADVDTLIGSDAGKSVRTIANEELAAQLIPEDAQESLDTLAEIAAWIQEHPDDASAMNAAIEALQAKVDTGSQKVSEYVSAAIAALNIGDYAKAADLTALAGRVTTAEGKLNTLTGADTVEGSVAKALKDAKAYTDEKAHEHSNKAELDKIADGDKAKWDAAEQNAKTYADGLMTWGSF